MFRKKEKEENIGGKTGMGVSLFKHVDEVAVGKQAMQRAGHCKNLHGHITEKLVCDNFNRNPLNIIQGKVAKQTKSATAIRDDIVILQKGRVVGRKQIKDTVSGIQKTVKQASEHHYKGTSLEGTIETTKAYNKAVAKSKVPVSQKMKSTGISSDQSRVIKAKTLGGSLTQNGSAIARESGRTGVKAGVISAGVGTVVNGVKVYKGEESIGRAAANVAKDSTVGAVSGAVGNAAGTAATIITAATPAAPVAPIVGTAASMGAAYVTAKVTDKAWNKGEKVLAEATATSRMAPQT